MSAEFCDTNVLVYAHDHTATTKRGVAMALLQRLAKSGDGVLSTQVLQELFVALTRKVKHPLAFPDARALIADLTTWRVAAIAPADILAGIDAAARWQISFWDALIVTSARKLGAGILWTEDLNDWQDYDGVIVRNPFTT